MANTLEKLAFEATQAARIGWYFGHKALVARLTKPAPAPHLRGRAVPDRQQLIADLWRLVERDWRNIEAGIYAPPEDGRGNPLDGLRRAADFFADLAAVEARRHGSAADVLLRDPEAERYPRYYRRMFHFQSDGYLSEASAERYDYQVEVLFGGGASLMRRQALVPLRAALRRHSGRHHPGGAGRGASARYRLRHRQLPARGQAQLPAPRGHRARLVGTLSRGGGAAPRRLVASRADSRRGGSDAVLRSANLKS